MAFVKLLFGVVFFHLVSALPHFNLDLTHSLNLDESINGVEHDCLHIFSQSEEQVNSRQILSYCLTEWPSKWGINENKIDRKYSFGDLSRENITSEQLYIWSAPLDIIEDYQFYLNQLSISTNFSSLERQVFYNCTLPRFGPYCQYSWDIFEDYQLSLNEIVSFYYLNEYNPTSLTCYTHLKCNRGSLSKCLDWTEICDGYVDCLDDAVDEEYCWQLYINECQENEFRCRNGQCIPKIYFNDHPFGLECLDQSDKRIFTRISDRLIIKEPIFFSEDIQCSDRFSAGGIIVTSSCVPKRNYFLKELMLLDTPNSISNDCWLTFKCKYRMLPNSDPFCRNISNIKRFVQAINDTCLDDFVIPAGGILYGHIYLFYRKETILISDDFPSPEYICYNDRLCGGFYPNRTLLLINNMTCRRPEDFPLVDDESIYAQGLDFYVTNLYKSLSQCNTIIYNDSTICDSSFMYRCINSSKCIPRYRLCNGLNDCDYKDDEECTLTNSVCSMNESNIFFKCSSSNKCISIYRIGDLKCDCGKDAYGLCDDETRDEQRFENFLFQIMCDGFTELIPLTIDGRNETDETECEYWPCKNNYTQCNQFWNCFNGADEVDCYPSSCPSRHHLCVSINTSQLICLPIEKANNNILDCVGGTDEPNYCRSTNYLRSEKNLYCKNDTIQYCMSSTKVCEGEEICLQNISSDSDVHKHFCSLKDDTNKDRYQIFLLNDIKLPAQFSLEEDQSTTIRHSSNIRFSRDDQDEQRCHRGLPLSIWLNNSLEKLCFCPSSYYGDHCQYQNERVSLTLRFRTFSESRRTLFSIVISLIEETEERIIHSYEQVSYYYSSHCSMKFNIYLLYSTRPKPSGRNYSIHIDIYEKLSLNYRSSFLIPIKMLFLPVNRIATVINIPPPNDDRIRCNDQLCFHGQCRKYIDDPNGKTFCLCDRQWSGKSCNIPNKCECSLDSLCVGISANNRSICICPLNRWGLRCLLKNNACRSDENDLCLNGGQCLPDDGQLVRSEKFICICPKGFTGHQCQNSDNKIIVLFHKDISLPQSIPFHFIQINTYGLSLFGSIYQTVPMNDKTLVVYWPHSFHVALARVLKSFYIIVPPQNGPYPLNLTRMITSRDRCDHIREVLNEKIAQFHLLRRMKYYHLACRSHLSSLSCFYDDDYFCFCDNFDEERMANCFRLNSTTKENCFGQNSCENGGECLQDRPHCPQTSICVCLQCFYGRLCQFRSDLFSLSLDAILGYHIEPHIGMIHQPAIVKFSLTLTIIIFIGGIINGIVSLLTFKNKPSRQFGCGFYLFGSSLSTLFCMIMFLLKYFILVYAQIMYITNRLFLHSQCLSIDILLRISLNMDQWLNACVAMERSITAIKGVNFNKKKSRKVAGYIIVILLILNIGTSVHDPLYRRLIDDNHDDNSEYRIWCIVSYPSHIQRFNLLMNIFHFCVPFVINFISALMIIIYTIRRQTKVRNGENYRKMLRKQIQKHKHILIAPIILVVLAIPRLIISLVSGCLKSLNESWIFLIGYFISFIPPIITALLFILPSKLYKTEFQKSIKRVQTIIRLEKFRIIQ